ncbi:inner nuclear membrane protein enriched at telomere/subtelomere region [Geranomyces michiganensis]|nr:inner nuclear membrane protein enriched at telomere/subtelomere region [Geranomyces michiganensis]
MGDEDYLADDFDPKSLKIAQLKSILGKHGVTTPTSQKKKEVYVDLFKSQITPFRERLANEAKKTFGKPPKNFGNGEEEEVVETHNDSLSTRLDSGQGSSANVSSGAPTPAAVRKRRGVAAAASGSSDDAQPAAQNFAKFLLDDNEDPFSEDNVFQASPEKDQPVAKSPKKKSAKARQLEQPSGSSSSLASIQDYGQEESDDLSAPTTPVKKLKGKSRTAVPAAVASPQPFSFKKSFEQSNRGDEEEVGDEDVEEIRPTTPLRASTRRKASVAGVASGLASPVKKTPAPKRKIVGSSLRPKARIGESGSEKDLIPVKRTSRASKAMAESQESSSDAPADEQSDEETGVSQSTPASPANEEDEFIPAETGSPSATEAWTTVTPKKPTPPPSVSSAMSPSRMTSTHKYKRPTTALPRGRSDSWNVAILLVVLVAGAFGMWYWEQKDSLEFCDPAKTTAIAPYTGYNPLGYVLPTCKRCPDHAVCVGQSVLSCESGDYIAKPDPITSLAPWAAPALPFFVAHPTCVLDTRKQQEDLKRARNVHMLLELLETTVRHWIGRAECGGLEHVPEDLRDPSTGRVLGMPTETARKELHKLVEKKWNAERFKTFWSLAMDEVRTPHRYAPASEDDVSRVPTPEIVERFDRGNLTRILIPAKPPIMPLACRLRRSIWETCRAYWMQLSSLGITVLFFVWFSYKRQNIAREARIVARVLDDVLEAASEEADAFAADPIRHPIPGLRTDQLRDYYLPAHAAAGATNDDYRHPEGAAVDDHGRMRFHIPDDAARTRIWDAVAALVQRNSSMKETVMDVQGQSHEVWQWIGSHALSPRAAKKAPVVVSNASAVKKLDFSSVAGSSSGLGAGDAPVPAHSLYPEAP